MVLYNRVDQESMLDVCRIYPPAKDYPEWNAMALSKIISLVNVTGPQGGNGGPGVSRTGVRQRKGNKSPIPVDATGKRVTDRDVSFGAAPGLMTVHVVGDGKPSTFKDIPEFKTLYDLVILHNMAAIGLYFGAMAHMDGPVDMYGKLPHTLATRMVVNCALESSNCPKNVSDAYDMYRFCNRCVKEPSWATGTGDPPKEIWAYNGAYSFGHYNDEDCVLESQMVANSPTTPPAASHTYSTVKGLSICYYFRIGERKANMDARKIREVEYRFL